MLASLHHKEMHAADDELGLGAFLPSVFSPLLSTIFTKVNYFQEPNTLPKLK